MAGVIPGVVADGADLPGGIGHTEHPVLPAPRLAAALDLVLQTYAAFAFIFVDAERAHVVNPGPRLPIRKWLAQEELLAERPREEGHHQGKSSSDHRLWLSSMVSPPLSWYPWLGETRSRPQKATRGDDKLSQE